MLRRHFVRAIAGSAAFSWLGLRAAVANAAGVRFEHGVASGDPLPDAVILWTRVSGATADNLSVRWAMASDPQMHSIVAQGTTTTGIDRDYTVKVDARGLPSGRSLWFQFDHGGVKSPVGRTKTLPTGHIGSARFAIASCANHPYGYFHAYREIAGHDDLDAVIHLGDYLYEYGTGGYATHLAEKLGRVPSPATEVVTLGDFRRRHAQYKADPDLQAMHAVHPLIAVWDDHEISNDAWRGGAQNHQTEDGSWASRRDAAVQAYLEWMPVRARHNREDTQIFRGFQYGELLSLIMLDTRLYGRDLQPDVGEEVTAESVAAAMGDPERRVLGRRQEQWLRTQLGKAENTVWQVIGQQVLVSPISTPDLEPLLDLEQPSLAPPELLARNVALSKSNPPLLLDTWDGYPVAQQDLLRDLHECAANPVVLSGDLHTSLAGNLVPRGQSDPVAVEFMTGSVTSPGFAEYLPEREAGAVRDATLALNPDLRYMETERRGWMCLTVTPQTCEAEWHLLDTVHSSEYCCVVDKKLAVRAGKIAEGLYEV